MMQQYDLFESVDPVILVCEFLNSILKSRRRPSASELVAELRRMLGPEAIKWLPSAVAGAAHSPDLVTADREYFRTLMEQDKLVSALQQEEEANTDVVSTIDALIHESNSYRTSKAFQEMIEFMARFRDYAPYNNMLVRLQNPSCSFYATARDWRDRFNRTVKQDARPMLILAPMCPVMLVYDLDQTEGPDLPTELQRFARFEGQFEIDWLMRTLDNAMQYRIRVEFKPLSSTHSGFATLARETGQWKMRVVVHASLDDVSRLGVLCHELGHIMLGHLGSDWDRWWPARANLDHSTMEVEAEAVAFIVMQRLGLKGTSAEYISRHLKGDQIPAGVSIDHIAKTAALIERMVREKLPIPKPRPIPEGKKRWGR